MRERARKLSEVAIFLERAERQATSDPAAALPVLMETLIACRQVGAGVQCLESQTLSLLGWILGQLERTEAAESAFKVAYRAECSCCRPSIDRRFASFLDTQGPTRKPEALRFATRAVEAAKGPLKGLALATLGTARYHAGDYSGAVEAHSEALDLVPVGSPNHSIVRANLAHALRKSGNLEDARRAERMLRGLPLRFRGLKYLTVERVKVAWMLAEILVLISQVDPNLRPFEKRQLRLEARDLLEPAVPWLERKGLLLDVAAARTDLAAIKIHLNPLDVSDALAEIPKTGKQDGRAFDISKALKAAKDAASVVLSEERKAQLCAALRALRDATVEAGAAPPVMSYG